MKITKFGHCCMLVEEKGVRILIDPGSFTTAQNELKNINLILITHEHMDHISIDSLKKILKNNPNTKIMTNNGVGLILKKEDIPFTLLEDGQKYTEKEVMVEGFGKKHEIIYETLPRQDNTAYLINNRFFYPGDSFTKPDKPVEILALPVSAPWGKISEFIDYAIEIHPKVCFPVHDGIMSNPSAFSRIFSGILESKGIRFLPIENGKEFVF
jgi:L-ascorbate metabolism protein UlaG (beta-lactamase superfamily)